MTDKALNDDEDQRISDEFLYLLDRGQQLFAGLRDLSDFGGWETYFQRTFEVYTRLWKFQQQHRAILEAKERYGLQRWEIGEIASKIGQLYYHYYLRTSDANYLEEAFLFYDAIRTRSYFKGILKIKSAPLLVKELRYYARFIVVCLLLEKSKIAKDLAGELTQLVNDYVKLMKAAEMQEWQLVLQEITLFLQADLPVHVRDAPADFSLPTRRRPPAEPLPDVGEAKVRLQSAILVGSQLHQVKFSELSLDVFRMVLTLERPPVPASAAPAGKNPRKFLLYRPTISTLLLYLASAQRDLRDDGVMLLYLSADGEKPNVPTQKGTATPYCRGGIKLRSDKAGGEVNSPSFHTSKTGFYPDDLQPFLRKPLFLVVDSDNSQSFLGLSGNTFGAPVFILTSPARHPATLLEPSQAGSLFTWFLHNPLTAFCFTVSKTVLTQGQLNQCSGIMAKLFEELEASLLQANDIPHAAALFVRDDFLRVLVARFIFCSCVMDMHVAFKENQAQMTPKSYPKLAPGLLQHSTAIKAILQMSKILGAAELFNSI